MNPTPFLPGHRRRYALYGLLGLALVLAVAGTAADRPTITDPLQIWNLPAADRAQRHPLNMEGRVNYFDALFRLCWLETNGVSTYLQLSSNPPLMRTGQQVRLTGTIVPANGLDAREARVEVLRPQVPAKVIDARGRLDEFRTLGAQIVSLEGYVDSQQTIDASHERLTVITDHRTVICWVPPADSQRPVNWRGTLVRVTGLYSSRFELSQTRMTIELWVGDEDGVERIGALHDDPRFANELLPIARLTERGDSAPVRIRGRVLSQRPGASVMVQDETGEVEVETLQTERFMPGTFIEAAGRIELADGWRLERALVRIVPKEEIPAPVQPAGTYTRAADIRALPPSAAAAGHPVELTGVVTWALPERDFFFLQDASGGIRVHFNRDQTGLVPYGKYFTIRGTTRVMGSATGVELATYRDLGSMSHPRPRGLTLDEARTGLMDGDWVEMSGFLQRTEADGDWHRVHLVTPSGDFVAEMQSPLAFVAHAGALVRVRGVCDVTPSGFGRPASVRLRVPFLHNFYIDRDAPADPFELPARRLDDLEKLVAANNLERVRVVGRLVHALDATQLYLEGAEAGDNAGLLVRASAGVAVRAGDRIEAVGLLGRDGQHVVLREAVYRVTGHAAPPTAHPLPEEASSHPTYDFRLVQARGRVIDVFHNEDTSRLMLQRGNTIFEAHLSGPAALPREVRLDAELELTGIYQVAYDDIYRARGFELLLRSPADVAVVRPAPLLTARRALALVSVLAAAVLLGVTWITVLRRRVRQQTELIRAHLEQQARVDAGVQHAARLESLGALAGGIAHDYNNLLTVILGNLSLLKLNTEVADAESPRLLEMERAAYRARDLARQLLTFASGGAPQRAAIDLAATVQEAVTAALRGTNVRAEVTAAPRLPTVEADHDQLLQAFQNVLQNAVEAMPQGGNVRITLVPEDVPPDFRPGLSSGRYLRLEISDEGTGIPPAVLPRIFDPYFSTRKEKRGLGLATVYSIINKHGGRIEAASRPGAGATFTLWLPTAVGAAGHLPPTPAAPTALPAGRARVLLMDDEESVRIVCAAVLRKMELEVVTVADGAAAVRAFAEARAAGKPFALVIADLTIPGGMGGKDAVAEIHKLDPDVPAIVASGYHSDPIMARYRDHGFQAMVAKPFEVRTLSDAVKKFIPTAKGF